MSPSDHDIEVYVRKLLALGYDLTLEPSDDMFGFLGIDFKRVGLSIELTQVGLIQKTIKYLGMESANSLPTPALKEPLGTDLKGEPFNEQWNYAAAIKNATYSAAVKLRVISPCSLLNHIIGQPNSFKAKPVRDFTDTGSCWSS